jgi:hypothetical protein
VKLSWNTTDASKVSITPGVGDVTPHGSTPVLPCPNFAEVSTEIHKPKILLSPTLFFPSEDPVA